MKFLIITDLEGVAGTDNFAQTRTTDIAMKGPSMKQLARETNACVEGLRTVYPDAVIDVLDGHGTGGLLPEDLIDCHYHRNVIQLFQQLGSYRALLFVGQHAMAGTINAPLNHTFNSRTVLYYRLNGVFIGEFGAIALKAGNEAVPTIFLAGDDKAALEAQMFVPEIVTAVTKFGTGLESAKHLDSQEACRRIKEAAVVAGRSIGAIPPFNAIQPPYQFEARHYTPLSEELKSRPHVTIVDERTYRIETDNINDLPF
ncbi:M55 family metallopeptidase [Paenibacillus cymbidii]|uniref:M55 family metallopeptidase n=1 Tax=Paenibacillus cymbidii TaxID=1639034 RepID=UPI001081154E|nr:M55 family metallopeptidase [Paenibacillus cymbidii]